MGSSALRKGRQSLVGHYYHVTFVTKNRALVFTELQTAGTACRAFGDVAVCGEALTLSYVVMPDHVHWLFELKGDLPLAVKLYKLRVAHSLGIPIWEKGYFDHALRAEEDIRQVARYIVANPLRAGLVTQIGDYPYWDAIWL